MPLGGDVVELVHEQAYLGQVCNNVYFFEAVSGESSLIALATWFEAQVVPKVKIIQVDDVTHINLRIRNIYNLAETYEEPLTGTGNIPSGTVELPSFIAYGIRLDHTNSLVRPGFKRFVGVNEASIQDALITASYIGYLESIAGELVNPPSDLNPGWAHVVVKRVCETLNPVMGAVPRCLEYRLPRTQIEGEYGYPLTFEVFTQPTSQNSRKWYT